MLARGADPNEEMRFGRTPFKEAARRGDLKMVKILVDGGAEINPRNRGDGSALLEAAKKGHAKVVEFLLTRGADVRAGTRYDGTPLIAAADGHHLQVMRLLVEHGADVNEALVTHYSGGRLEVPRPLTIPIEVAAESGDTELVRLMLDKGARITGKNNLGKLALMVAVHNGHTETAKLLRERGLRLTQSQLAHLYQFKTIQSRMEAPTAGSEMSEPCSSE